MKKIHMLLFLVTSISQAAVHINPNGLGEVLLIPYYTTNNGMNTNVTVSNTTEQVKAVKFVFREGRYGRTHQGLSVYLAPNDVWTFGMLNYRGTEAQVISHDLSCAPYFQSPMALYDGSADPQPPNGFGYAEGLIEIYEMGELDPSHGYGQAVTFEGGLPRDCSQIEANWAQSGIWNDNQGHSEMLPPAGGLKSSVALIDVENGVNYTYDAIAFDDFYPEDFLLHSAPFDSYSHTLSLADTTSRVQHQGDNLITQWSTGFEAVSAVLTKNELVTDYSNELNINAQTEVVMSFPTRGMHR
ncbi:MAG: hypothetical protein KDI92_15255, partial [Xanthomonadales bacterium]|nr:hypothetical protein [Xanthomonadales bacterium]